MAEPIVFPRPEKTVPVNLERLRNAPGNTPMPFSRL